MSSPGVVRELVTRLSFSFDRTNLDRFEKSITSFKTKFLIATAALSVLANKTLNYFSEIAKASVDTDNLARATETATEDVIQLRKAYQGFKIPTEQFNNAFLGISDLLRTSKRDLSEINELFRKSEGGLNLQPFIENNDIHGAFEAILTYIGSIASTKDQIAAIEDIFKTKNTNGFLDAALAGPAARELAFDNSREFAQNSASNSEKLSQFNDSLIKLTNAFDNFSSKVVVILEPLINDLTVIFNSLAGFFDTFKNSPKSLETIEEQHKKIPTFGAGDRLLSTFYETGKKIINDFITYPERLFNEKFGVQNGQNSVQNAVTNNINITVPPTTEQQVAEQLVDAVKGALQQFAEEQAREIISNNPQVE